MAQQEIEIKKVNATEVAIPTKKTLYVCVYWSRDGFMQANTPSEEKRWQEEYALSMSKYAEFTSIYKFDIDVPNFKNNNP